MPKRASIGEGGGGDVSGAEMGTELIAREDLASAEEEVQDREADFPPTLEAGEEVMQIVDRRALGAAGEGKGS